MGMTLYFHAPKARPAQFAWEERATGVRNLTVNPERDLWVIVHGFEGLDLNLPFERWGITFPFFLKLDAAEYVVP